MLWDRLWRHIVDRTSERVISRESGQGVKASLEASVVYALAAAVLVCILLKPALGLFFTGNVDMNSMLPWAKTYIYMSVIFYIPLSSIFVFRNTMQGCGYGFLPMMGGVSELVARLVVAMISMAVGSYALACFCDPAAWVQQQYLPVFPIFLS